jgi:hypothetical protein
VGGRNARDRAGSTVRAPAGAAAVAVEAQIDKRGFNESIRRAKHRLEGLET